MDASGIAAVASKTLGTNVQVATRCRPFNSAEKKANHPCVIACEPESKIIKISTGPPGKKTQKSFAFDKVFGMYSTQEEVFEQMVRPIVDETLAGFNCTIFAYGQTGTGKTHTMEGDIRSEENAGIVPRSIKYILEQLELVKDKTIRVSFLELYNEELQDLLRQDGKDSRDAADKRLKLCEDTKKGVVVQNLEEITVMNKEDIFSILQRGIQQRQTAATLCNKNSSRSHSIFTMKIMIKECDVEGEEVVRHGQLNLVDLAGSECVGRSGARDERATEAGNINKSLLTLGRVITALVDHHGHIPYRDSKLTRLLQESLGGKAKTCIIATLSPSQSAAEESMSTLDYAHRARNIKNIPNQNTKLTKVTVMKDFCAEIEQLKAQLQLTREKNGVYVDPAEYYAMESRIATLDMQLQDCESSLRQRTAESKTLLAEREEMVGRIEAAEAELLVTRERLEEISGLCEQYRVDGLKTKVSLEEVQAVVEEQKSTESCLRGQGSELTDEVRSRRSDVDSLLEKVDFFSQKELEHMESTKAMIQQLQGGKAQLFEYTTELQTKSQQQSAFLKDGVCDMLLRGKQTCADVCSSIDSALLTLVGDATTARDSMTTSCDSLDAHLRATNTHIESTLRGVQQNLSAWLGEVDVAMKTAQEQLLVQQSQLNELAADIASRAASYAAMNEDFAKAQTAHATKATASTRQLQRDLQSCISAFQHQQDEHNKAAKETISSHALALEAIFKAKLQDLVQESLQSFSASTAATSEFCGKTQVMADIGFDLISADVMATQSTHETFSGDLTGLVSSASNSHHRVVDTIIATRQGVDASLEAVSGSVVSQRSKLDTTVHDLLGDVSAAVEKGCDVVSKTSGTAKTVLDDITQAAHRMNKSAGDSMVSFSGFLDNKGEAVSADLGAHFTDLSQQLERQNDQVDSMVREVVTFGKTAVDAKVVSRGSTPTKRKFGALPILASTRPHDVIRMEVRTRLIAEQNLAAFYSEDLVGLPKETSLDEEPSSKRSSKASSVGSDDSGSSGDCSMDAENSHPNSNPVASAIADAPAAKVSQRLNRSKSVVQTTSAGGTEATKVTTRIRSASATVGP